MRLHSPAIALVLTACLSTAAFAAGRPAEGRAIAERWCVACHQIGDRKVVVTTVAPAFESISARYSGEEGVKVLEGFLADPHPRMPDMSLTRQEIRDLVAFIGSL